MLDKVKSYLEKRRNEEVYKMIWVKVEKLKSGEIDIKDDDNDGIKDGSCEYK